MNKKTKNYLALILAVLMLASVAAPAFAANAPEPEPGKYSNMLVFGDSIMSADELPVPPTDFAPSECSYANVLSKMLGLDTYTSFAFRGARTIDALYLLGIAPKNYSKLNSCDYVSRAAGESVWNTFIDTAAGKNPAFGNPRDVVKGSDLIVIQLGIYEQVEYKPLPDAFTKIGHLVDGGQFVIAAEGFAMVDKDNPGYTSSETALSYSGLDGKAITVENNVITSAVSSDMVWTAEKVSGGFALKNLFGQYLNCSYAGYGQPNSGGHIFFGETPEAWTFSGGALKHVNTGKYLVWEKESDVSGTPIGNANLITIRSSADPTELYMAGEDVSVTAGQYYAVKVDAPTNGLYLIVSNDNQYPSDKPLAMTTERHNGFTNTGNADYYGLKGVKIDDNNGFIVSGINENMIWKITSVSGGYNIQTADGSKYLDSEYPKGGGVFLGDNAELWSMDQTGFKGAGSNKYMTQQNGDSAFKSGNASELFTVRSKGRNTPVSFYEIRENVVVNYTSDAHGSVTVSKDYSNANHPNFKGTTAVAKPGYVFDHWVNGAGDTVGTNATFIPTVFAADTYKAIFKEDENVVINYVAGENGSVSLDSESVAPATGSPSGATAVADNAYHFLNWTDSKGNVVSKSETFVPYKNNQGIYFAETYTANFEKDPVCIGEKPVAVKSGTVKLAFDGKLAGEYILNYVSNGWTIWDPAQNMYVAISGSSICYTQEIFVWKYDGGFYYSPAFTIKNSLIAKFFSFSKYYLTVNDGKLGASRTAVDVAVIEHFVNQDHALTLLDNGDGTHTGICDDCGARVVEKHTFTDHYCACGACDIPGSGVTNVTVNVQKVTKEIKFLFIFNFKYFVFDTAINCTIGYGATVKSVDYRSSGSNMWKTGSNFNSLSTVGALDIRVTDSDGNVTYWYYDGVNPTAQRMG